MSADKPPIDLDMVREMADIAERNMTVDEKNGIVHINGSFWREMTTHWLSKQDETPKKE